MKQRKIRQAKLRHLLLMVCVAIHTGTSELSAADRFWTGEATPGPDGFYETPGNWAFSQMPTLDDKANFNVPGQYTVILKSSPLIGSVQLENGQATFVADANLPKTVTTVGGWTQLHGTARLEQIDLVIGQGVALEGTSFLALREGSDLEVTGPMTVGGAIAGDALLEISGQDSLITVEGVTRVGHVAGGTGTLRLSNAVGEFHSVLNVGAAGTGTMQVEAGANVTLDGTLLVAAQHGPVGSGTLVIAGEGTLFDIEGAGEVAIGVAGRVGEVRVTNGGYFSTGAGLTEIASGSKLTLEAGEIVVEGVLRFSGILSMADQSVATTVGLAQLNGVADIGSGSQLISSNVDVASMPGATGAMTIHGAGSRLQVGGGYRFMRSGQLTVSQGGGLQAATIALGTVDSAHVEVNIVGEGARLSASQIVLGGDTGGGPGGSAAVAVSFGGIVEYTNLLHILDGSQLTLDGGELRAPSFATLNDPGFHFEAGTYTVMESATINSPVVAALPGHTLSFGRGLRVEGTATLGAPLSITGGKLEAERIIGGALLDLQSGTIAITGETGLAIGSGGALGTSLTLDGDSALEITHSLSVAATGHMVVAGGKVNAGEVIVDGQLDLHGMASELHAGAFTNSGRLSGEGRLMGGPVNNTSSGNIAVAAQRQLRLGGTGHTSAGRIELADGRLEVDGHLTNLADGDIVGRGTLSFGQGLTNQGDLVLAGGATDIFGDVTNDLGGRILVSGGAEVVFWDDVTHQGTTFNVSPGASVTFFGEAGFSVSGGGDVYFEEDITPGSSPGMAEFGGDVYFGGGAHLILEVAGTTPGTDYDTLKIQDTAYLGGELSVELLNGFNPQLGQQFVLLTADQIQGGFNHITLPTLANDLAFELQYGANSLGLSVISTSPSQLLAGDYNDDGVVDAADYAVWRNHVGTSVVLANDDLGGPIGAAHYNQWKANFGARRDTALATSASAVPEPASIAISLLLAATLLASRRAAA